MVQGAADCRFEIRNVQWTVTNVCGTFSGLSPMFAPMFGKPWPAGAARLPALDRRAPRSTIAARRSISRHRPLTLDRTHVTALLS